MPPALQIFLLPHAAGPLEYATHGAAGMDLRAAIPDTLSLKPGERARVPIGVKLAIPEGYEGQVRPRSGLADRCGVTVLNSPGTIDSDYRGELQVLLINSGSEVVTLSRGDRIAQLVLAPVSRLEVQEVQEVEALGETRRGEQGFGSTGAR